MPIIIPKNLPASKTLKSENIFVMNDVRAHHQDIRPIRIAILNLMPKKIDTETQLLRLIGNTPLQVDVELIYTQTHVSKNTSEDYLLKFYKTFKDIKNEKFDGMVITGAPVETLPFEDVEYWNELKEIMDYTVTNVTSTLHICWGAQAGLYHHYGIPKHLLQKKLSGVFLHHITSKKVKLLRGFDDEFYAPHSRHSQVRKEDIKKVPELHILAESKKAGPYIISTKNGKQIFIMGHSEYDPLTLKNEYERDISNGLDVDVPENYYPDNNPLKKPIVKWRGHANLLFSNWLNYYLYQETPYDLSKI